MGNAGSQLRCCKCDKVLPPYEFFSIGYRKRIHRRHVFVFNKGEYYRTIGSRNYECRSCFYKPIRDQEQRSQEEERRREEEIKMKEEEQRATEAKEKKRQEELSHRLEESHQQAQKQHEEQRSRATLEERESQQHVLLSHPEEFETYWESDGDELLETLASKCGTPIPSLSLAQLTPAHLGDILNALDKLLFDEWLSAPPSLSTLQHAQVFITELCAQSLETAEEPSLQSLSNHLYSQVESISQSACSLSESFVLTQALYVNLMHFLTDYNSCDSDAALLAKRWAEEDLPAEDLYLIEFLGTLTWSLQSAVSKAGLFTSAMEIQSLKLLLSALTHLNGRESHSEPSELLLRLVQTHRWTPGEAVTLLKALSEKFEEDAPITEVLTLVRLYDLSPEWTDDSGHSLIQVLGSLGPDRFQLDLRKSLRKQDASTLGSALAEVKMLRNLDDSVIDMMNYITTGVLGLSENAPNDSEPFLKGSFECADPKADDTPTSLSQLCKAVLDRTGCWSMLRCSTLEDEPSERDSFKSGNLKEDDLLNSLYQLCKGVFHTKGWWPTVQHMLRWCVLVLTGKDRMPELVGVEDDPCVIAMFAAMQVRTGSKLDIVLSSDVRSRVQMEEWSDFYKHLGISLNTNVKTGATPPGDVYEADIVYGTLEGFVSDYLQYGLEVSETGNPRLCRGFIIVEGGVSHEMDFSRLKDSDALVSARQLLQSLMVRFQNEHKELRHWFIKALFQVLRTNLTTNKQPDGDSKIIDVLRKCAGEELPPNEVYILTFLENLLRAFSGETETQKNGASQAGKLCLEVLFACVIQICKNAEGQAKELLQKVSDLVARQLWSPVDALNLLVVLTEHHHNEDFISIMQILHLLETYQVSSGWVDESNQSVLKLLSSTETDKLIQHLEKSFRVEKEKSIACLFEEIRQMETIDEQTLEKSHCVVKTVTDLIKSGGIKKHTDVRQARDLSHSTDTEDLQEVLAVLCNAVHQCYAKGKWWPRATQMISWCLLALSDTGKLLEMGTGEGKSCVIAMFAVLRALRGEKVDVLSSSSVLCQRDAQEWKDFYSYFGITADTNTDKTENKDRKCCYWKDVVYGTIEAFAADHLRQVFEMKDVRPDRSYQCIIIDEVDSLLLDQGVQLTYLSSPMVSMQHLNIILAMIWGHVSQYGFLSTGHQTFVQGPPASFFNAIFDSIDTEGTEIDKPMDILCIAEESNIVPEGFTEDFFKSGKDELLGKLKIVSQDAMVDFFQEIEHYVPYGFTVYTIDDDGLLCLRKPNMYNRHDIPNRTFLVLGEGLCCALYDSEEILIQPIAELISEKIQYTPCTNAKDKISIPGFLRNLIEKKISVWVQNAFLAIQLREGREYVVENDSVCPVDFRSTGIVELSKKWGDGLQQFVEIKHQIKLSTISTVTNYISNICFFEKYHGKIYGTTGTLGNETEMLFLRDLYPNLSTCKLPTFNRKKLFEVKGTMKNSTKEWKSEIKDAVMAEVTPNSYRGGRAALVICESINTAKDIYEELKSVIPGEAILYSRSNEDSQGKLHKELLPGDVIVGTNLAGRGTDIKVSEQVNNNGGLFVILSFLSENTRVELQAFGRTARKGKPGSAQVIMTTDHLQEAFRRVSCLEEARSMRDRLAAERIPDMMSDVSEMKLREDLFSEYCSTLQDIHRDTDGEEKRVVPKRVVVAILNEFWGIWLQTKSEELEQLKRSDLQKSLKADLSVAKSQSQSQTSPCSSIYHYIKFGNIALGKKEWDTSTRLFERAMEQDESWAAIAFYSHAYCTINQKEKDYLTKAMGDLRKAQESLKYLTEECMVCLMFVKKSSADSTDSRPTSLEKQITNKCNMLGLFDQNISEAIKKLEEIQEKGREATASKSSMFSLVSNADEDLQVEAYNLYSQGLEYVFSVEKEPRFPWEAVVVFCLGLLQIIGGTLLTVYTFGTLAQIGIGLITEGISDCIYGIESMVTGEFSWKSWAIEKAISVGITLIGFGIGKLLSKGFKGSKVVVKVFGKEMKLMPKFLSRQAKGSLSVAMRTQMRTAVKFTAKTIVEKTIMYGIGKAEELALGEILNGIKSKVKEGVVDAVKSNIGKEPLAAVVDSIILSHLEDTQQLSDLLQDENRKNQLLSIFSELSNTASQPLYANLGWQNKLSSSILAVMDHVKSEVKGKIGHILTAIKISHLGVLAADAIWTVTGLSDKFFSNLHKELKRFQKEKGLSETVKQNELSASQTEMLKEFQKDLADTVSTLLADALVEVFHQKFSGHIVSQIQGQVNGVISQCVRTGLNTSRTLEKLKAGQKSRYIACMPVDLNSEHAGESGTHSQLHAEKIINPATAGTTFDIKVLSEATDSKVVILTEGSNGKLKKMHVVNPSTNPASQTVTLIYRPTSDRYPEGHYDVLINNKTVSVSNKDRSCLFQAFAQGLNPEAGERAIALEAHRLRTMEADTLLRHPSQWEPFIKRKVWIEGIRGGDWFVAKGGADNREVLRQEVGKVEFYKDWKKYARRNPGVGQDINADHQPPVSSIIQAKEMNQNSKLAESMLQVATKSESLDNNQVSKVKKYHGLELPTVYVPQAEHRGFPSTISKSCRTLIAETISQDDVVGTFKYTILSSVNCRDNQTNQVSRDIHERSFEEHSIKMIHKWQSLLQNKEVMNNNHVDTLTSWIRSQGYKDQNDPHRKQISSLLQLR
ncbi:hypothetical protein NFI96_028999, partial [Prochilodus magdalenae]